METKKSQKSNFYKNKKIFKIDNINVNKILVSKEEPYSKKISFKYLIGYDVDDVIKPLCIKLPQMIRYIKCFESNKTIPFKINDNNLLKKVQSNMEKS